jgi:predicted SAM-dependent methyltransferase
MMRIHFGAGKHVLPGFFNVDAVQHPKARPLDLLYELRFQGGKLIEPMPLPDGCADELHSYHVIEHFFRYDVDAVVAEWRRVLRAGGRLVLELPNLEAACRNLLAGMRDQMGMWPIYGDWSHGSPYMMHKHGYTPTTITGLLADHGFQKIAVLAPQTHMCRENRDMRVEAVKC